MAETPQPLAELPRRPLVKNRARRACAGVCAGIADTLGVDVVLVRLAFLVAAFVVFDPGKVLLVYIGLCIAMPDTRPGDAPRAQALMGGAGTRRRRRAGRGLPAALRLGALLGLAAARVALRTAASFAGHVAVEAGDRGRRIAPRPADAGAAAPSARVPGPAVPAAVHGAPSAGAAAPAPSDAVAALPALRSDEEDLESRLRARVAAQVESARAAVAAMPPPRRGALARAGGVLRLLASVVGYGLVLATAPFVLFTVLGVPGPTELAAALAWTSGLAASIAGATAALARSALDGLAQVPPWVIIALAWFFLARRRRLRRLAR